MSRPRFGGAVLVPVVLSAGNHGMLANTERMFLSYESVRLAMSQEFAGMKLRCKDGHWEMADFELRNIVGASGFEMWVYCEAGGHNGGHWLAPESPDSERVAVVSAPYQWPSAVDAFAARDRFALQQGK